MLWQIKKTFLLVLTFVILTGCGYSVTPSIMEKKSVLGDGTKTVRIVKAEQETMLTWPAYYARNILQEEINKRQLAKFVSFGPVDYELEILIPRFVTNDFFKYTSTNSAAVVTANEQVEIIVRDASTKIIHWRSGLVSYTEIYEGTSWEEAVQELTKIVI